MSRWRVYLASTLLTGGVASVASEIDGSLWWRLAGYVMLALVPRLVVDEARRKDSA